MTVARRPQVMIFFCGLAFSSIFAVWGAADENIGFGRLHYASSVSRDSLQMVTSVDVSRDGSFLYAAAWRAAAITSG
jgi:hypothetical protein